MQKLILMISLAAVLAVIAVSAVKVQRLQSETESAVQDTAALQSRIGLLEEENRKYVQEISALLHVRAENETLREEIKIFREQITGQQSVLSGLSSENESLREKIAAMTAAAAQKAEHAAPRPVEEAPPSAPAI